MLNKKHFRTPVRHSGVSPTQDLLTYRMIVGTLSITVVSCIVGSIWLQVHGHSTPDLLTGLGTGAIGALAGLLVPAPSKI